MYRALYYIIFSHSTLFFFVEFLFFYATFIFRQFGCYVCFFYLVYIYMLKEEILKMVNIILVISICFISLLSEAMN